MSDDTRRILELVAQGKITVAEAGELLKALKDAEASPDRPAAQAAARPQFLRIRVHKQRGAASAGRHACAPMAGCFAGAWSGDREVDIRVPLSLVRGGMRLGAIIPGPANEMLSQALRERGFHVDLAKIKPDELDAVLKEMGEITLDVDHGRAQVRISAE